MHISFPDVSQVDDKPEPDVASPLPAAPPLELGIDRDLWEAHFRPHSNRAIHLAPDDQQ